MAQGSTKKTGEVCSLSVICVDGLRNICVSNSLVSFRTTISIYTSRLFILHVCANYFFTDLATPFAAAIGDGSAAGGWMILWTLFAFM